MCEMEFVYTYVKKHASASYHSSADESLESQVNELLLQCKQHNSSLHNKQLTKKLKKQRLANEISLLLRIKEIIEQKGDQWGAEKRLFRQEVEKISQNLLEVVTTSSSEMYELRTTANELTRVNFDLQQQLQRYKVDCEMKERELTDVTSQLLRKDQYMFSLNEQKRDDPSANICTVTERNAHIEVRAVNAPRESNHNSNSVTIQDKITLCQILGEFNTLESPVSLSNRFEAVVLKYSLNNEDACSLLKAWIPGPLFDRLSSQVKDNLADAEGRMKALQRVLSSRDLQVMKFVRGMDPIVFCSLFLSLYKKVYNCPDLSPDDASFLYAMANKCYVDYPTKIALRNAASYQRFTNLLRDWCEESRDIDRSDTNVSIVTRNRKRRRFFRCYRCNRPGHIQRFCRTPNISCLAQEEIEINVSDPPPQEFNSHEHIVRSKPESSIPPGDRVDKEGFTVYDLQQGFPMFAPWANIKFWMVCIWPQILMPWFMCLHRSGYRKSKFENLEKKQQAILVVAIGVSAGYNRPISYGCWSEYKAICKKIKYLRRNGSMQEYHKGLEEYRISGFQVTSVTDVTLVQLAVSGLQEKYTTP
ncbi:posterior protein-like [Mantella aurantiaca]